MATVIQPGIVELLETSGARPRGNRHDCPKCQGYRTVTHTAECFYCHKCGRRGNTITLAKELGLYQRVPNAEYLRQRKRRQEASVAAGQFLERCRAERLRACNQLRELARLEALAHDTGPNHPVTWDALALVYRQWRSLTAKAALLSDGSVTDRRHWLESDGEGRERTVDEIVTADGLYDSAGKFVEVNA